jgi:malate synthase
MSQRVQQSGLSIAAELHALVADEIAPGTGIDPAAFWASLADIVTDLAPDNRALLEKREALQRQIDDWHVARKGQPHDAAAYQAFLLEIGYLVPEGPDFQITTSGTDPEISQVAGPQLVVPVMNARFALNAANARWGSLYDALYGTDVIAETAGAENARATTRRAARRSWPTPASSSTPWRRWPAAATWTPRPTAWRARPSSFASPSPPATLSGWPTRRNSSVTGAATVPAPSC